ncbi:hypothetical protein [Alteribacter keqinensis]|uniref:hypothetical protein n=1 Tax=Alteribacter keqinensis TaxID=2483800 RepID=UPI00160617DE|nr:hypothetical protein [Alteribacter keqinensis]
MDTLFITEKYLTIIEAENYRGTITFEPELNQVRQIAGVLLNIKGKKQNHVYDNYIM